MAHDHYQRFEARAWLRTRSQDQSFAINHFDDDEEAADFVEDLYVAGAAQVNVFDIVETQDLDAGRKHSSSMEVMLPRDTAVGVREAVIVRAAQEHPDVIRLEGDTLFLWWD